MKNIETEPNASSPASKTTDRLSDPVCGVAVDPARAVFVEHEGAKVYFYCQGCATKFRPDPTKYLKTKQEAASTQIPMKEKAKVDNTCPHALRGA